MAKENTVILYGMVERMPRIMMDPETDEYRSGKLILTTIRRTYVNSDFELSGAIRADSPCVFSKNKWMIRDMLKLKKGDMVLVKGSLSSMEGPKRFICPECGTPTVIEGGVVIYVDPLLIKKCEDAPEIDDSLAPELQERKWKEWEGEAFKLLRQNDEISNLVITMGRVTIEPDYYESPDTGKKECMFKLAIPRKRRIPEDGPEKKTDFTVVKTYGQNAAEYANALTVNSMIHINGAIQTREIVRSFTCQECGTDFERPGGAVEIVPYDIEYIANCRFPAQTEVEEADLYAEAEDDLS